MERRYISNNFLPQTPSSTPDELLQSALLQILKTTPPRHSYSRHHLGGLFTGYTGLAYLFLQISALHPNIDLLGHSPRFWAKRYLDGSRGHLVLEKGNCGLASEKLSYEAVRACVTGEMSDMITFISNMPALLGPYPPQQGDPYPSELAYGRAGTLYLLRLVEHWVPNSHVFLHSPMTRIADKILETDDDGYGNWEWHGKRYFGAAHGDIGIITQLVLTVPSMAPQLADRLEGLLDLQLPEGNWPSSSKSLRQGRKADLVQWCHGAPGFVHALQSLRPYFPGLQNEIDDAIDKAQELTWKRGLLTKEPSLCHGIFGNGLSLPTGETRNHFMALTCVDAIKKVKDYDPKLFEPATYGKQASVLMNYFPSAAWAWAVYDQNPAPMIMFNDV
ncbi:hypothetical protein S7711_00588 [Stachybotrys chartarum IBT 7711]|uniref:Uncharacterized protein n=1 Tax=Stachybotrys chartarum (strain CBS 109288 / IBT 7711) TaxID=1280523 RepID=A0A084ATT5_STACB|nr:hypothetical protein S7711_00588 [Stachybotrys chartarum IBT 7711]KFA48643.1 hypothetical protein S40293_04506 [Stachybotrys chartarum IBT 40293]